ncbi:regulator [Microbacterium esteraromaticum]|uniref:PaaX family transcriptional regulator n=1 Tax=Microbacterium esteraromaticum TaxID=57043 RepID=UPI001CD80DB5|nr:PaaX family transcriptional regulator C-terminal domain-containing protein [Microbacterium esteraromaticum]MCA1307887.1 regulator [Microbacterium esteraromaticum]
MTTSAVGEAVLDDIDARPGSTTSLLRTLIGVHLRPLGGVISSAALVRLAGDLGIPPARARTAITRLKQRSLLLSTSGGYAINPAALPMLRRGDRRIFDVRTMGEDDGWMLVSATVPESRRDLRHQLRRRLLYLGAGSVAPSLWILPGHLFDEAHELLHEIGAREYATLFLATDPQPSRPLPEAVADWWDLVALRAEHDRFLASVDALDLTRPFAAHLGLIDSWRVLPYIDPGLPTALLPADWPGARSVETFQRLHAELAARAADHVRAVAADDRPATPPAR